jgi:hypothetical protein
VYVCIYIYLYLYIAEYYLDINNEILSFVEKWMELEIIRLIKISQIQKGNYPMFYLICGI